MGYFSNFVHDRYQIGLNLTTFFFLNFSKKSDEVLMSTLKISYVESGHFGMYSCSVTKNTLFGDEIAHEKFSVVQGGKI